MLSTFKILFITIALLCLCACSSTASERQSTEEILAKQGYSIGPSIDRIQRFRVNGWNYVDRSHVIITVDASRRYLISLRAPCNGLFGAEVIAFTNTVSYLTNFDQLLVKDSVRTLERCPIDSMNELKREEKAE
jgi:hypothetical protein